MLSFGSNNLPW